MTIYLYIKTHKITGLKYLGITTQDPFKYIGSGKDWLPHLKKHGQNHYTEIIKECQSKKDAKQWGQYYSRYYNILNAVDDYGNRIWLNRIPEGGSACAGGAPKGRIPWNKGLKGVQICTEETRQKMKESAYNKGRTPWNKGIPMTDIAKAKAGKAISVVRQTKFWR
jgi:hypothetical protein